VASKTKYQVNYSKKGQLYSQTINADSADDAEEKAIKKFNIMNDDIRSVVKGMKDGGLMEAIEKVKAKGMEEGGNVPKPKMRPKKDPFRADKTIILNEEFSKRVAKANEEAMKKAKKMESGGEALGSPKFGAKSGVRTIDINTPTGRRKISEIRKILPGASRDEIIEFGVNAGVLKKEKGGEVPAKFKGFSKLPEAVQEKMDPGLAKKFEKGGPVKMGSGGGVCRGMGAARAGGKFKLR
tara:strand:- start:548 stop:1264 length:717 start_codon:yes stop_codon:yes gene_type:complete